MRLSSSWLGAPTPKFSRAPCGLVESRSPQGARKKLVWGRDCDASRLLVPLLNPGDRWGKGGDFTNQEVVSIVARYAGMMPQQPTLKS